MLNEGRKICESGSSELDSLFTSKKRKHEDPNKAKTQQKSIIEDECEESKVVLSSSFDYTHGDDPDSLEQGHYAVGEIVWRSWTNGKKDEFEADAVWFGVSSQFYPEAKIFLRCSKRQDRKLSRREVNVKSLPLDTLQSCEISQVKTVLSGEYPCLKLSLRSDVHKNDIDIRCPTEQLQKHLYLMAKVAQDFIDHPSGICLAQNLRSDVPKEVKNLAKSKALDEHAGRGQDRAVSRVIKAPGASSESDDSSNRHNSSQNLNGAKRRPFRDARSPRPVARARRRTPPGELEGFRNLGNTCYISSVISTLCSLTPFANDILSASPQGGLEEPKAGTVVSELQRAIAESRKNDHGVRNLAALRRSVCKRAPQFANPGQHDVHEFATTLSSLVSCQLRRMESRTAAAKNVPKRTVVPGPDTNFRFTLWTKIRCKKCQHSRLKKEQYRDMSLDMGEDESDRGFSPSVSDLIDMFLVNKVVQLKCEQEGCDGDEAIIETKLGQLPRFFVLSLKRFRPTEDGTAYEKLLSKVEVSDRLEFDEQQLSENALLPRPVQEGSFLPGHDNICRRLADPSPRLSPILKATAVEVSASDGKKTFRRVRKESLSDTEDAVVVIHGDSPEPIASSIVVLSGPCQEKESTSLENQGGEGELFDRGAYSLGEDNELERALAMSMEDANSRRADLVCAPPIEINSDTEAGSDGERVKRAEAEPLSMDEEGGDGESAGEQEDEDGMETGDRAAKAGYLLQAVVSHTGNAQEGHYLSDVRDPETGEWLRFDDSFCIRAGYSPEDHLRFWQRRAYLLVYAYEGCFQSS